MKFHPESSAGRFVFAYVSILTVTIAGALLAHETIGEIECGLYLVLILLAQIALLIVAQASRRWGLVGALVLAMLVVPYQTYLGVRLLRVRAEAERIVSFAYAHREQTGSFPPSLEAYTFTDPAARPFIQDYKLMPRGEEFILRFRVATGNTSHWYSDKVGWQYYPD